MVIPLYPLKTSDYNWEIVLTNALQKMLTDAFPPKIKYQSIL